MFIRPALFLIVLFVLISCSNFRQTENAGRFVKDSTGEETFQVDSDDHEMQNAILTAKSTLSLFDSALTHKSKKAQSFSVKKRFTTETDGGEHIWITDVTLLNNQYRGVVNNTPISTKEVAEGDTVTVNKDEITDWMYVDGDVLKGGYTIRVAYNHMTRGQKDTLETTMGFKIR